MKTQAKQMWKLLIAAFVLTILPALSSTEATDEPYLVKEFTLDNPGQNSPGALKVETSGGNIQVVAQEGNVVRVEMYVKMGGKTLSPADEAAKELLKDYTIDISQSANSVSALAKMNVAKRYNFKDKNHHISFKVFVPKHISSNLHTSGGAIHVEGIEGEQEVKTSGGNLTFKNINGKMEARTSGGNIKVDQYKGALNARTSGGSIKLSDAKGDLNVHTSGGNINIENASGSVEAFTSGGSINASLLTLDKQLKLRTSGGNIKAVLPQGLGLDLDLKGDKVNARLQNFSGQADKDRVKGSMNGGGVEVVMSTSGGNISLEYQ